MVQVNTIIETKHFIECPYCQKSKSRIDHLFTEKGKEKSFGIWYCDECGGGFEGMVKGRDVFVEKVLDRRDKSIVFLKNANVLLVVKGGYFDGEHDTEEDKYFYTQHTCPTNYFKDVEMVIDLNDGDTDPHGIFEFVGSIPYVDLDGVKDVMALIPSIDSQP